MILFLMISLLFQNYRNPDSHIHRKITFSPIIPYVGIQNIEGKTICSLQHFLLEQNIENNINIHKRKIIISSSMQYTKGQYNDRPWTNKELHLKCQLFHIRAVRPMAIHLIFQTQLLSPVEWGDITIFLTGLSTGFNMCIRARHSTYSSVSTQYIVLLVATLLIHLIHWNSIQTF